jgi:hypothetical protein
MKYFTVRVILVLVAVLAGFLLGHSRSFDHPLRAQTLSQTLEAVLSQGRFQIAHIYYSTSRQGTALVDSQTGRVWELAQTKDGDEVFQEITVFALTPKH